jgi:hypothetical protein
MSFQNTDSMVSPIEKHQMSSPSWDCTVQAIEVFFPEDERETEWSPVQYTERRSTLLVANMSSTPRKILDLPSELLDHTFRFLSTADHNQIRFSCKQLSAIATPLLFEDARFTLSTRSIKRLKEKTDEYYGFIRMLTHVPLPVWPECPDYNSFCSRFCDEEREGIYGEGIDADDPRAMKDYEDEQQRRDTVVCSIPGRVRRDSISDPKPHLKSVLPSSTTSVRPNDASGFR